MQLPELDGLAVCLLGYGRDGQAVHDALRQHAPRAVVTAADAKPLSTPVDDAQIVTGAGYLQGLDRFDVIVRAPGIRDSPELDAVADRVTTSTQIFFDTIAGRGVTTIGITGSKGKSTTTSLIGAALRAAYGDRVTIVGNIGIPMMSRLTEAVDGAYFVIELSSYQLETLHTAPHIAVLTSLFPEHLDRHGSMAAYRDAKARIAQFQSADDVVFFNARSADCADMAERSPGRRVGVRPEDFPAPVETTRLRGEHNRGNLALAYAVALECGVLGDMALAALQNEPGLPYRLNSLGVHHGIEWIDDSLATAPEPTIAALQTLGDRVDTVLLGGQNRGFDFTELGAVLAAAPVRNLILFPDSGAEIREAVEKAGPAIAKNVLETRSMLEAVEFARRETRPGALCLLSSASPSYSVFANHADKSRQFADAILTSPR